MRYLKYLVVIVVALFARCGYDALLNGGHKFGAYMLVWALSGISTAIYLGMSEGK